MLFYTQVYKQLKLDVPIVPTLDSKSLRCLSSELLIGTKRSFYYSWMQVYDLRHS